jgi:DNA mismatch endonuclease (patch repair protein)
MSRIRSKETGFEQKVFVELKKRGVRFKTHYVEVAGKPDIALPGLKKAVLLHSDFWHGWRLSQWEHILPSDFWKEKLHKNRIRDKKVLRILRKQGWKVLVVWQHQIKSDRDAAIAKIVRFLAP